MDQCCNSLLVATMRYKQRLLNNLLLVLLLVEVVTSHGPMTPKRLVELEEMFSKCDLGKVFVSAFPDFAEFRRHTSEISWETEIWIAENPDHMIHYNGDKFMGPR